MLWIHFLCELVSETFRRTSFWTFSLFRVIYPDEGFEGFLHDESALLAAMWLEYSRSPGSCRFLITRYRYALDVFFLSGYRFRRWLQVEFA